MKLNVILFLSLLTALFSCNAQNAAPNTSNEGVGKTVDSLGKAIMVIFQDKAGNYWFGSRGEGVFRDDGKNLLNFTVEDGLVSNNIWGIQQDQSGNLYFDTQDGVSKFDGKTFTTLKVSIAPKNDWKLEANDLWFKGNWNVNGTYRYDGKELHHLEFPKNELEDKLRANFPNMNWSPYGLYSIYKDQNGHMWFGTSNLGIYRFDGKNLSWMYENHLTNVEENGGSFGIRSMLQDEKGKFWFCNTTYRYNVDSKDFVMGGQSLVNYLKEKGMHLKTSDGKDLIYYLSITEDNKHNLWMATYNEGVWKYDPSRKKVTHYEMKDGSKEITLFSIFKDKRGDLWLGTHESGVYKFDPEIQKSNEALILLPYR